MTIIVIDTNAVHRDPWLKNQIDAELLELADRGECKLVFPRVVIGELHRQQSDWVAKNRVDIASTIDKMRGSSVDVEATAAGLEKGFDDLQQQIDSSFDGLLACDGVEVREIPLGATERLVERDLARRRPFLEVGSESWSAGFRDAVIWETVLEILDTLPEDEQLIVVTDDKGFLANDKKTLHEDLLEDLDQRGIARDRVISAQTMFRARAEIEAIKKETDALEHAALVRVATDALFELDGEEISQQLQNGGDFGFPYFVNFQVPPMESATIVAIDQDTEFVFERDGHIATASAEVLLSVEGATFKSEYPFDDGDAGGLEIVGDLNDHYFETSAVITVRAVVEIDTKAGPAGYESVGIVLSDFF